MNRHRLLVASVAVSAVLAGGIAFADTANTDFESFSLGTVNGQGGWTSTGAAGSGCATYDHAVVSNTYGFAAFGAQTLRISNAVTSGCFSDQTFSNSLPNEAGETDALNGGMSGGIRHDNFTAQFDFASTQLDQQPGLAISVSPDRGDGARMSYLRFEDGANGINVFFDDVQGESNPTNFVETQVATDLSRSTIHTAKFVIDFVDGPSNDVVKIYIDGVLVHTGTTWENYYRFDPESNPSLVNASRTVDSLIFRTGGAPVPANAGKGFLIDNVSLSEAEPVPASCPVNTVQNFVESVDVPSTSSTPTVGTQVLANGTQYLFVASGTWQNSNLNVADAEYASTNAWASVMDGYNITPYFLGAGEFDLQVNGAFVSWGAYATDHEYTYLSTGSGVPASFLIFDGDSTVATPVPNAGWYGDNTGMLSVDIYSCDTPQPTTNTIAGMKYNDLNRNGKKDANEPGLPGWTIKLKGMHGQVIASTITDANGNYSFTNLPDGTYKVREQHQNGWKRQSKNPKPIVLSAGSTVSDVNFGNAQKRRGEDEDNNRDDDRDDQSGYYYSHHDHSDYDRDDGDGYHQQQSDERGRGPRSQHHH